MRISDWSSDVCSSDLRTAAQQIVFIGFVKRRLHALVIRLADFERDRNREITGLDGGDEPPFATFQEPSHDIDVRSEEHTSELQSLMRISSAVFCVKKTRTNNDRKTYIYLTSPCPGHSR